MASPKTYEAALKWTADTKIMFGPNRKRPGTSSADRYDAYAGAQTIGDAIRLGASAQDLLHDFEHRFMNMRTSSNIRKKGAPLEDGSEEWRQKVSTLLGRIRGKAGQNINKRRAKQLKAKQLSKDLGINLKKEDEKNQDTLEMVALRKVADAKAKQIMELAATEGRKITDKEMIEVLRLWSFNQNVTRQNVIPDGQEFVHSDTLGLIAARDGRKLVTKPTKAYPYVSHFLCRWFRQHRPNEIDAAFPFTSINVNFGYAAKRHRDGNNQGPSMIIGFGKYTGGELKYWGDDDKTEQVETLKEEHAEALDISTGLVLFDGNRAHEVTPFVGERYSVVFFSINKHWKATDEVKSQLAQLEFELPTTDDEIQAAKALLSKPLGYDKQTTGMQKLTAMFGVAENAKERRKTVKQWPMDEAEVDIAATLGGGRTKPALDCLFKAEQSSDTEQEKKAKGGENSEAPVKRKTFADTTKVRNAAIQRAIEVRRTREKLIKLSEGDRVYVREGPGDAWKAGVIVVPLTATSKLSVRADGYKMAYTWRDVATEEMKKEIERKDALQKAEKEKEEKKKAEQKAAEKELKEAAEAEKKGLKRKQPQPADEAKNAKTAKVNLLQSLWRVASQEAKSEESREETGEPKGEPRSNEKVEAAEPSSVQKDAAAPCDKLASDGQPEQKPMEEEQEEPCTKGEPREEPSTKKGEPKEETEQEKVETPKPKQKSTVMTASHEKKRRKLTNEDPPLGGLAATKFTDIAFENSSAMKKMEEPTVETILALQREISELRVGLAGVAELRAEVSRLRELVEPVKSQ